MNNFGVQQEKSNAAKRRLSMQVSWSLGIEDERLKNVFLRQQQKNQLRVSWACLLFNVLVCG